MADYFQAIGSDDEDDFLASDGQVESRTQLATFLVSAPCAFESEETFTAVRDVIVNKIVELGLMGANNRAGVIFYGTTQKSGVEGGAESDNVYRFIALSHPTMETVGEFATCTLEDIKEDCGEAVARGSDEAAQALLSAVDLAQLEHSNVTKSSAKEAPVTMVFLTADPNPLASHKALRQRMVDIVQGLHKSMYVMVAPICKQPNAFPTKPDVFWNVVQKLVDDDSRTGKSLAGVCLRNVEDDIAARWPVTKKTFTRRVFFNFAEGVRMPVQMMHLAKAPGARPYKWLDATTNQELVSRSALICGDTGAPATKDEITRHYFLLDDNKGTIAGLPGRIVYPKDVAHELRAGDAFGTLHPSLTLVAFKPASAFTVHHQVEESMFLYIDDNNADKAEHQRNARMFMELWDAMDKGQKIALCTFKRAASASPRLVAVCVVQEEFDENDKQVTPPGFSAHILPYGDELRRVTADPKVLSDIAPPARAPPAAVAAAEELVDAMSDPSVTRASFRNTEAAFALEALKCQVLQAPLPAQSEFPDDASQYLQRRAGVPVAVRDGFFNEVMGGSMLDADAKVTKKRPAPSVADSDIVQHTDWKKLAQSNKLGTKTADHLKAYCKHHKLPVGGNKGALVERVAAHALAQ